MNTKKIAIILVGGIIVLGTAALLMLMTSGKKNVKTVPTTVSTTVVPTKEVEFVVVRVLPSGFSPSEVTIKKGMIVRFTNPLEDKVTLKWEGERQYTNEAVYEGNDIATTPFDTVGTYTFTDDATKPKQGRVVVK